MTLQPALSGWLLIIVAAVVLGAALLARSRQWGLIAAAVLLLGALLRPIIGGTEPSVTRVAGDRDPNVFLILDRSADMAGAPISQARNDIEGLIDRYPDARFAVIGFAARPALDWPLSADAWSLRPLITTTDVDANTPADTANAGAAGNVLRYQLIGATQQFPRARNLVFYLGAGTPESTVSPREFNLPDNAVDGGAVLGYGTAGEPTLQAVAEQIGVPYVPRGDQQTLDAVLGYADDTSGGEPTGTAGASGIEVYWVLSAAAAVLLLGSLYRALRKVRR